MGNKMLYFLGLCLTQPLYSRCRRKLETSPGTPSQNSTIVSFPQASAAKHHRKDKPWSLFWETFDKGFDFAAMVNNVHVAH